jgi:hypothetical protein
MVLVAKASDYFRIRGPFAAASLALSGIGYTILYVPKIEQLIIIHTRFSLTVPTTATKVRYAAIVLAVTGTYSGFPVR